MDVKIKYPFKVFANSKDQKKLRFAANFTLGPHVNCYGIPQVYDKTFKPLPGDEKRKLVKDVLENVIRDLASSMTAEALVKPGVKTNIIGGVSAQLYNVGVMICSAEVHAAMAVEGVIGSKKRQDYGPSIRHTTTQEKRLEIPKVSYKPEKMPITQEKLKSLPTQEKLKSLPTQEKLKSLKVAKQTSFKSGKSGSSRPFRTIDPEKLLANRAPEPPMRETIRATVQRMGGTDITWLNRRVITVSDLRKDQNRLYLPDQIVLVLTAAEKKFTDDAPHNTIPVLVVDYTGGVWETTLRLWKSLGRYVLVDNWHDLGEKHGLRGNEDRCEIWSFRGPNQTLCLAMNFPDLPRREQVT